MRGDVAVVLDPPVPRLTADIAVDFALDLDSAVVRAGLQLPVTVGRAASALDHVLATGNGGSGAREDGGARKSGDARQDDGSGSSHGVLQEGFGCWLAHRGRFVEQCAIVPWS